MDYGSERQPLISSRNDQDVYFQAPGYNAHSQNASRGIATIAVNSMADELPPPYIPSPHGGVPMINCKVCQALISIEGKTHQHVVKCSVCNEATPIKTAPPGKKYVRCPCNCLLICKATSQRIACPRASCQRTINLTVSDSPVNVRPPGMSLVCCVHCGETFLFNILNEVLARCPHCRKVSSVGPTMARRRALSHFIIGIILLAVAIGVTVGTLHWAQDGHAGIYALFCFIYLVAVVLLVRSLYFGAMKVSSIEGPA